MIGQGRERPVEFLIFDMATMRVSDSLGINSLTRSPLGLCLPANNAHPVHHISFFPFPLPPASSRARALARHGVAPWVRKHQTSEQNKENNERRRIQSRRKSNNMNKSTNKNDKKDSKGERARSSS